MACDNCFRLKIRCDNASPKCSSCTRQQVDCTHLRPDQRKTSKLALCDIFDRIRLLETALKENNIPLPPRRPSRTSPPRHSRSDDAAAISRRQQKTDAQFQGEQFPLPVDETDRGQDRGQALIEQFDKGSTLATGLDPDIELLVKRTGSLQLSEHGQLKFFGATSNVHFLKTSTPFQLQSRIPSFLDINTSNEIWLGHNSLEPDIPLELEDHLIKLYFSWENAYFRVVDEKCFMNARQQALNNPTERPPSCYSELLVYAMCSWGALFSDHTLPGIQASGNGKSLHDIFITRARQKLECDMDNPTTATVQALAVMSGSVASRGQDSRGWLYIGMASQVALHLGMHMDVEHFVRSNDLTREEAHLRSTAFWGTYVVDTAWSYYFGRPVMPVAEMNRNPPQIPSQLDESGAQRTEFWENYTDQGVSQGTFTRYPDPVGLMWTNQVKLSLIMERLQRVLYDKCTLSINQLRTQTSMVTKALEKWMSELPPELKVDSNDTSREYLPHVLVLHAQYHEVMIFANHPFFTSGTSALSTQSRRRYTDSAKEITKIMQIYKRLWTLRRLNVQFIHPMFTASVVHLYIACTSNDVGVLMSAIDDFEYCCCHALRTVAEYFDLAAWQLRSIDRIRQEWHDLLEGHPRAADSDANAMVLVGPQSHAPPGFERWATLERIMQKALDMTSNIDSTGSREMEWYNTWTHIRDMFDLDPFSVGVA